MRLVLAAVVAAVLWTSPAVTGGPESLLVIVRGVVTEVIDGAVIGVEGIDVDIRLVSIQAPK